MKFGGDIFSYSEMLATGNGLAKRTLNRGEENNYMMVFPGVTESGEVNTKQVSASEYYGALQAEDFIYDASFIKLKELSIGYSFPSSMLKKTPVNSLNVSFVARNLCYLMKHTPAQALKVAMTLRCSHKPLTMHRCRLHVLSVFLST